MVQAAGTSSAWSASPCHAPHGTTTCCGADGKSGWLMGQTRDEGGNRVDRLEVLRHEIVVCNRDPEPFLQERHELHDTKGIEYARLQQRRRVLDAGKVARQVGLQEKTHVEADISH